MLTYLEIAGLPIGLDSSTEEIVFDSEEVTCTQNVVKIEELSPALLNKSLRYPQNVYTQLSGIRRITDDTVWPDVYSHDIVFLPVGLLGIEYIKTHIFYSKPQGGKIACLVQVLAGELTVILQKNACQRSIYDDICAEDARIVDVKTGEKLAIPAGYYYTFINTGTEIAIFSLIVHKEIVIDYSQLRMKNGLAYYVIAKNARQEVVTNPRYRTHVDICKNRACDINRFSGYRLISI
jgi:hypothetical protein